jgi:hypothetical protein
MLDSSDSDPRVRRAMQDEKNRVASILEQVKAKKKLSKKPSLDDLD